MLTKTAYWIRFISLPFRFNLLPKSESEFSGRFVSNLRFLSLDSFNLTNMEMSVKRKIDAIDSVHTEEKTEHRVLRSKVVLTAEENRLLSHVAEYAKSKGSVVRCAGGWVRDKLLGLDSCDVDFAVDNMKGTEFALGLKDFLVESGFKVSSIGSIKFNPEQSKHLETATFHVDGLSIDCNSLRTDTYANNSRVPEIRVGTPLEDALRRDFTMNALFYNINTMQIEDLLATGLDDLRNGLIRTPLKPLQTFLDDPLRILRAIRFAARFGFTLDDELQEAASAEVVKNVFTKVSRERFGIELYKMLKSTRPFDAFSWIVKFKLHFLIFDFPPNFTLGANQLELFLQSGLQKMKLLTFDDSVSNVLIENRAALYLTAFLSNFSHLTYQEKTKVFPLTDFFIVHSIKLKNELAGHVAIINETSHDLADLILAFAPFLQMDIGIVASPFHFLPGPAQEQFFALKKIKAVPEIIEAKFAILALKENRLKLGRILRRAKHLWPCALILCEALLSDKLKHSKPIAKWMKSWIEEHSGLNECWTWSAYLRGDLLATRFQLPKSGIMGKVITGMVEWRYQNEWIYPIESIDDDIIKQCFEEVNNEVQELRK